MAPNEHLINSICRHDETRQLAVSLLRQAHTKTGAGSGYELGPHTTGLPAICAHVASVMLNNGDVSRKDAQVASCLKTSDFTKALQLVQAALKRTGKRSERTITYEDLHEKYAAEIPFSSISPLFGQATLALIQLDNRCKADNPEVKCGVFHWICNALKCKNLPTLQDFADDNGVSQKLVDSIVKQLNAKCNSLKTRVVEAAKRPVSPVKPMASMSPTKRSPTKQKLRELPSRDSPKKRTEDMEHEQNDSDVDLLETPTKKRKLETPTKPRVYTSASKARLQLQEMSPSKDTQASANPVREHSTLISQSTPTLILRRSKRSEPMTSHTTLHTQGEVTLPVTPSKRSRTVVDTFKSTPNSVLKSTPTLRRSVRNESIVLPEPDVYDEGEEKTSGNEEEQPHPRRRFRPIFLDRKQWCSLDPRVDQIWKQVEKQQKRFAKSSAHLPDLML